MGNAKVATGGKRLKPTPGCSFRSLWTALSHRQTKRLPRRSSPPAVDDALVTGKPPNHSVAQMLGQQKAGRRTLGWQVRSSPRGRQVFQVFPGLSEDLDSMMYDHQRDMGSSVLLRASSGNVMVFGNWGNLRPVSPTGKLFDDLLQRGKEASSDDVDDKADPAVPQALSMTLVPENRPKETSLGPDELNSMGSMEYKKGRFTEALPLFEQATMIAPGRALYWNNKAMVLTSLGRLLEAVTACMEAVKIDPSYCRAHHRLATLYLRLGEADRAMHHYKQAGDEVSAKDMWRLRSLQDHLAKCSVAREIRDWNKMLKEAQSAVSAGADSSPKVFAFQAEALLSLQRHPEAETILIDAPTFDIDASTEFFGASDNGYILMVRAQIEMAAGRFDNAVSIAQKAAQIDPKNKEIAAVAQSTHAVALSRTRGNDLLRASKFAEACAAYGEGLAHDPQNSVLLCDRAACHSKLGQWEKAIEDCNVALRVHPSYKKARLRRAACYAKLARWEDSIQDYQILVQQTPGDEELLGALSKVQSHLMNRDAENINDRNSHDSTVSVNTDK